MKIDRRTVLGGAVGFASAATAARAAASTEAAGGGAAHEQLLGSLESYMEQHRADWGLPGLTLCAVDRDGFKGFVRAGWADEGKRTPVGPDHLFQIGSISKMVAALAVWSLIDDGKLSPDDRLKDLLPAVKVRGDKAITLQHLLNHTSGLPGGPPVFAEDGLWSGYAPGSHWSYSNVGYELVGLIASQADGRPYSDCVEARVLRPLGMKNSAGGLKYKDRPRHAQGYEPVRWDRDPVRPETMAPAPWVNSESAAGCIAATTGDMALFLRFLIGLAEGKGGSVLSDASAVRFLGEPAEAPGWSEGTKYGNGVAHVTVDGRDYLHHTGGMVSFSSALYVDPKDGVAAFASSNVHYGLGYRPRDVAVYACRLLAEARGGEKASNPAPTKPKIEKPAQFAGVFTAESGDSFEIIAEDAAVRMRRNGESHEMRQAAGDYFACRDPGFETTGIKFERENDKAVRAWAGVVEYLADPSMGYKPPAQAELQALAGRYDSDNRWDLPVQVFARDGGLWLGNAVAMTSLKNGEWRFGDEDWSPERARFENEIGGRPQRLILSGTPYRRRFS